ncbi:MAG: glucose-6-phosphate isomerase, partial [Pseudomonadota bacterium]|nr:glucose-6-phosphate isomerase [Pseudomonadota bacterium]
AQQELIASGHTPEQAASIAPHKVIEGNRPSNTLLIEQLTPKTLGALTALYEHKVFTLSVLLGINAFDQWGVELGKQLGSKAYQALKTGELPYNWDSSTALLAHRIRKQAKHEL